MLPLQAHAKLTCKGDGHGIGQRWRAILLAVEVKAAFFMRIDETQMNLTMCMLQRCFFWLGPNRFECTSLVRCHLVSVCQLVISMKADMPRVVFFSFQQSCCGISCRIRLWLGCCCCCCSCWCFCCSCYCCWC